MATHSKAGLYQIAQSASYLPLALIQSLNYTVKEANPDLAKNMLIKKSTIFTKSLQNFVKIRCSL